MCSFISQNISVNKVVGSDLKGQLWFNNARFWCHQTTKYCRSFVRHISAVIHNSFGDADLFLGCATYFKTNIDGIECKMNVALLLSKVNYSPEGVIYKRPFIFSDLIGCLYKPSLNITLTLSSGTFNVHVQPSYFADGE